MEEIKQRCVGLQLQNEDVYMATTFQDFIQMFVRRLRGEDQEEEMVIDYVSQTKLSYSCLVPDQFVLSCQLLGLAKVGKGTTINDHMSWQYSTN